MLNKGASWVKSFFSLLLGIIIFGWVEEGFSMLAHKRQLSHKGGRDSNKTCIGRSVFLGEQS